MIDKFEWPHCARCNKGVDSVKREIDLFTGDLIYTITCHGNQMIQRVTGIDLHDVLLCHTTAHWDEKPTDAYPSVTYVRP